MSSDKFLSPAPKGEVRPGDVRSKRFGIFSGKGSSGKKKSRSQDADYFRMQMEVTELRKRIKILDGDTGRDELLDLLQEKEEEIKLKEEEVQRKEKLLHNLNDKFHEASKKLESIEEEKRSLWACNESLEKEKKDVQQQLDVREKEVLSLVRRFKTQEDVVKERAALRKKNLQLQKDMEALKQKLNDRDSAIVDVVAVQKELSETLEAKKQLQEQIGKLKKDHEALTDTLNTSFANIQKLTKSQQEKDEERQREKQRAQIELEKLRLEHEQEMNQLREDTSGSQERIQELELKLQQQTSQNTKTLQELEDWMKRRDEDVGKISSEYESKHENLEQQYKQKIQSLQRVHEGSINNMRSEVEAKELVVATLEKEISNCMEKLMSMSNSADKDDSGEPTLADAMGRLEHERGTLRDQLAAKEAEVIELTATVCRMESDNIILRQETKNYGGKVERLENERMRIKELEESLKKSERNLLSEQNKRSCIERENQKAIESMQDKFQEEKESWSSSQQVLREEIVTLQNEKRDVEEELTAHMQEHHSAVNSLEKTLSATDGELENYEAQIAILQTSLEEKTRTSQEDIRRLQRNLQKVEAQLENKENEIRDIKQGKLKQSETTAVMLQAEIESLIQKLSSNEMDAAEIVSDFETKIHQLEKKLSNLEAVLNDERQQHQRSEDSLKQELALLQRCKTRIEEDMKSQALKLQERHSTITSLTRKNTLLEQRERTLRVELDLLITAEEKNRIAHVNTIEALERQLDRERTNQEDDDIRFQEKQAQLLKDLSEAHALVEAHKKKVAEAEEMLEQRTTLLGDMVEHNKKVEIDLEAERARSAELENQLHDVKKEDESDELNRLTSSLRTQEEEFLDALHRERHLREIAEADLEKANMMLCNVKRDNKDLAELEKENNDLKDKVRRQEAYLKRKLQKEKILRERSSAGNSKNIMGTPAQNSVNRTKAFGHLSNKSERLGSGRKMQGSLSPLYDEENR